MRRRPHPENEGKIVAAREEGTMRATLISVSVVILAVISCGGAAAEEPDISDRLADLERASESARHKRDVLAKKVDDVLWYLRVGDVAMVEKTRIYGPPRWKEENPTGVDAGNPLKFYTYLFTPKGFDSAGKLPLLVLPHGGVHADFTTYYAHIVRELVAQGYIVVAPEYRGSTGYGKGMYEDIDYGGLEVADALAARDWAVKNHPRVDPDRVGILGWSHGGLITLFSLFRYPDSYACGFAGVPVSDLVQRMGYHSQGYRDLYEAEYFIGASAQENLEEYKRRSPVWSVDKLTKPLRIHTNIHDEDVNYVEVEHLIQALTAADKDFEHEVSDVAGGHSFDRLDTPEAWSYREKIYAFLARYLKPPKPQVSLGITAEGRAAP
jgi:dipeptidyl aminopeptidase/acylaminoacyl peptidase